VSNEEMGDFLPRTDGYVERKMFGTTDVALLAKAWEHRQNVLIKGPTGTGKTHAVRHVCFINRLPYMRVGLNGATTPEQLIGQWVPFENGFRWQDGVLTSFIRNGGVFVCDEINAAPPEILFVLHSILDDERRIVLTQKDGEVVIAHKDFWFVATMNEGYAGTKPMNVALLDRFQVVLAFGYDDKVEKKLIKDDAIIKSIAKIRAAQDEFRMPASTRSFLELQKNIGIHGKEAAYQFFLNRYNEEEAEVIRGVVDLHDETKRKAKPNAEDDGVSK